MPTAKWVKLQIIPLSDLRVEIKKAMKGVKRPTKRYASKDMFQGRDLLAIQMILGVLGSFYASLYVTVNIADPNRVINDVRDANENLGNPITPLF